MPVTSQRPSSTYRRYFSPFPKPPFQTTLLCFAATSTHTHQPHFSRPLILEGFFRDFVADALSSSLSVYCWGSITAFEKCGRGPKFSRCASVRCFAPSL